MERAQLVDRFLSSSASSDVPNGLGGLDGGRRRSVRSENLDGVAAAIHHEKAVPRVDIDELRGLDLDQRPPAPSALALA
jgi:hypothetical protein